jgi:superfamily I DNA/RNA helicase
MSVPSQFSPMAEVTTLNRNYRSTQPILAAANGVIDLANERSTKNLLTNRQSTDRPERVSVRDEAEQARYVAQRVLENREVGTDLKQQAVLFRASHHSGPLEVELTRRNVAFVRHVGIKRNPNFSPQINRMGGAKRAMNLGIADLLIWVALAIERIRSAMTTPARSKRDRRHGA